MATRSLPLRGARNPGSSADGTNPGSFAMPANIGGPLSFSSPDTPGMPAPSEKTAWDFLPEGWSRAESGLALAPAGFRPVTQLEHARLGVVTNQSGVARGLFSREQLRAVHARLCELLGPFDVIVACPHDDEDGCTCRKPRPGMVRLAADLLDVDPSACVMIGDTGADVAAANGAGAVGVMVPNDRTRPL